MSDITLRIEDSTYERLKLYAKTHFTLMADKGNISEGLKLLDKLDDKL